MDTLRGDFLVLVFYDVAERIDLNKLRSIVGAALPAREPSFVHPAPGYVRFENPPVVEQFDSVTPGSSESFACRVKYFDYGVIGLELSRSFNESWEGLINLASRWIAAPEIEICAAGIVRECVARVSSALVQPYESWLSEDYCIIHVREAVAADGESMNTASLLSRHGGKITQIVRGEPGPLSDGERAEALQSAMSYFPTDLLVTGWVSALIVDSPEGAAPTIQLLEYANTQLLEFRHYDELLTRILAGVYKLLEHRAGLLGRWKMAREAERLNAIRLDITELTEASDNSIKFLSDMFYARAYRVAAQKVGVNDYRHLVEEKLRIAGELYEFMVNEFHQARAFVLEVMVVAILVIELIHLFRGGW
jgi:hypothetical protein